MVPFGQLTSCGSYRGRYVEVKEDVLRDVLRLLLSRVLVDEEWYLRTNGDVHAAIRSGDLQTAQEHYVAFGYFEDRLPRQVRVDEKWYLEKYQDVADAIELGKFQSAEHHFNVAGFKEGRLPHEGWDLFGADEL